MKKLIAFIVFIGLIVLLAMTCPDEKQHRETISARFSAAAKQKVSEELGSSIAILGGGLTKLGAKLAVNEAIQVDDYFIFSVGKTIGDKPRVVSVGLLNKVFTGSVDTFKDFLDDQLGGKEKDEKDDKAKE